ncbi:hypothetical protein MUP32_06810 [Candidatus Microgenomates bacterium]|nr:hypothetical protein [Candidatus Microgenomates bacterium]
MVLKKCLIFFLAFFLFFLVIPQKAEAATCNFTTVPKAPLVPPFPNKQITLTFDPAQIRQKLTNYPLDDGVLRIGFPGGRCARDELDRYSKDHIINPNFLTNPPSYNITEEFHYRCGGFLGTGDHAFELIWEYPGAVDTIKEVICSGTYNIQNPVTNTCEVDVTNVTSIGDVNSEWKVTNSKIKFDGIGSIILKVDNIGGGTTYYSPFPASIEKNIGKRSVGTHQVEVLTGNLIKPELMCSRSFKVQPDGTPAQPLPTFIPTPAICSSVACPTGSCSGDCSVCPGCPDDPNGSKNIPQLKPICDQLTDPFKSSCWDCMASGNTTWTAIGCIPNDFSAVIRDYVLVVGISIAGGTSFLYFLYGAFLILTSAGNAEAVEEAKQIIISALSGLLLIIFSIFLLRVIGVDILRIPGFI